MRGTIRKANEMIVKYEKQAVQTAKWFATAAGVFLFCIVLAMAVNLPTGIGIFIAVAFAASIVAMLILYFRGFYFLARAKGYSAGFSLLMFVLFFLDDVSNPAKEAEEEKYTGPRCVCCNIRISPVIRVCPKCGWTQPAAGVPTPV